MPRRAQRRTVKKRDTAAQRFYNRLSLPPAVQSTSAQQCLNSVEHGVTQEPATPSTPPPLPHYQPPATPSTPPSLPCYQPPATQSSPCLPRYQPPATQRSPSLPLYQPLATQSSPPLLPYYHLSGTPSEYQSFFIQPLQNYPLAPSSNHPQYPQHHTAQPVSFNQLQQMPVLTNSAEQWKPTTPSKLAAKESFLKMLYSPIVPETPPACPTEKSTASSSEYENSSFSSSAASSINEIAPVPKYGEPSVRTKPGGAWKPCEACKPELAKLMEENEKLEEVLCSIGGEQLEALKSFLEKVEQIQPQAGKVVFFCPLPV
ncbi:uncharacterized protein LOC128531433 [Clarias gariepinus]|uniref:uncharacterized protein LOC128531433 n=1 Tax=Clarias gariepinus TaxID=13013 RepID=UPI00234D695E|nr:uncharacterized protein LOC128531433 [Clarias gariepinus]